MKPNKTPGLHPILGDIDQIYRATMKAAKELSRQDLELLFYQQSISCSLHYAMGHPPVNVPFPSEELGRKSTAVGTAFQDRVSQIHTQHKQRN